MRLSVSFRLAQSSTCFAACFFARLIILAAIASLWGLTEACAALAADSVGMDVKATSEKPELPARNLLEGEVFKNDQGETCFVTETTCVEPGGTRVVDGIEVVRDCWATRDTYACLKPDESAIDGCASLQAEADGMNAARCRKTESACAEEITGVNGEKACLSEKESWACEAKIDLPPINAAWTGEIQGQEEVVDESACRPFEENEACVKGELACTDQFCTRTYLCGGRRVEGCSVLLAAGCTSVKDPVCDAAVDPACGILQGEVRCKGPLPEGVIESESAEIIDSSTVNVGTPKPDASACAKLEDDATSCRQISQTCVDRYPTYRVINGKGYSMPCWGYERVMQCTTKNPENTCQGLAAEGSCSESARTCVKSDDLGCIEWNVTYACGAGADDVEAGGAELVEDSTTIDSIVEVSTCREFEENPVCRLEEEVCLEGPATKVVDGVPVYKDCWKTQSTFVCGAGSGDSEVIDECAKLAADPACKKTESQCLGTDEDGSCLMRTETWVCGGGQEEVEAGVVCDGEICIAGLCEPTTSETSKDFLEGIALMEIIRQAGVYAEVGQDSIFGGTASSCTTKAFGFSCCSAEDAQTASSMDNSAFGVALTVGIEAGWEAVKWVGSPFVYDILSSYEQTSGLLTALYGTAGSGVYSPSLSYYGVSVSISSTGSMTLNFSPAGFLAAAALEMAAEYFSCEETDRMHVLREARGLCHYVGSWCDKSAGSKCLEKKESWVCFNSKLARIIAEQGREQLGLSWGTPRQPLTRGFTLAEFQSLDFSRMDLSAIVSDIALEASKNGLELNVDAVLSRSKARVEQIASGGDQYVAFDNITGKCALSTGCSAGSAYLIRGYGILENQKEKALRHSLVVKP